MSRKASTKRRATTSRSATPASLRRRRWGTASPAAGSAPRPALHSDVRRLSAGIRAARGSACFLLLLSGCSPRPGARTVSPSVAFPPSAAHLSFTDVTAAAGVQFRHTNGAAGRRHLVETMGSGCAFTDLDGDGWPDLFFVNGRALPGAPADPRVHPALYRNNRDGTFTDITPGSGLETPLYGMGCAVGDYDGDGKPDLYVTCALDESRLFHNEGGGRFRDVTRRAGVGNERRWGASCAWLDYDRDQRLDLFVTNYVGFSLAEERPCLRAGQPIYCGPMAYASERCRLYRNRGDGTFADVSGPSGIGQVTGKSLGVAVWDFDGKDGPEILVANDVTPNFLFWNQGNGTFTEEGAARGVAFAEDGQARAGMGIDVAQTTTPDRASILIANFSREPNTFLTEQADSSFLDETYPSGMGTPSLPYLGFGLLFGDFDLDGRRDAVVANGHIEPDIARFEAPIAHAQPMLLLRNLGDRFQDVTAAGGTALAQPRVGRGLAAADFDQDGDTDLVVTTNNGAALLLRNDVPASRNWVRFRPLLRKGGPVALGARITVTAGGRSWSDQCRSGSSYLSASDPAVTFALPDSSKAEQVQIVWPNGRTDVWRGLQGGQEYHLVVGSPPTGKSGP